MARVAEALARVVAPVSRRPSALAALAVALCAYVLGAPLLFVRYPPIIDLPFHAAQVSILRHYGDPAWGFSEQFSLHPFEMPYLSMYGIGLVLSYVMPIHWAAKAMTAAMLALLPIGLGVLFWGMKKSPWLGLLGLSLCWNTLTHWGFLNFLGAIGLMAMAIGLTLRLLDRPSIENRIALALCLIAIHATHVYRVPFAILGVLATAAVMYPVTRRLRPVFGPLVPVALLFALWFGLRDETLVDGSIELGFDLTRLADFRRHLFGAYAPPHGAPPTALSTREAWTSIAAIASIAAAAGVAFVGARRERRTEPAPGTEQVQAFRRYAGRVPLLLCFGLLVTYLVLPLEIGQWFYVYPREAVSAAYFLLGTFPNVPLERRRAVVVFGAIAVASLPMARLFAIEYRHFETLTEDFQEIAEQIPKRPRLFYLVYEARGTDRRVSPFLHLPAWVQAEKGGALNFHFVRWNHSLIRYRSGSAAVPPALPDRFEWTPQHFNVEAHGPWFDTFLVRHRIDPSVLFAPDPSIQLVTRRGMWWLFRRIALPVSFPGPRYPGRIDAAFRPRDPSIAQVQD